MSGTMFALDRGSERFLTIFHHSSGYRRNAFPYLSVAAGSGTASFNKNARRRKMVRSTSRNSGLLRLIVVFSAPGEANRTTEPAAQQNPLSHRPLFFSPPLPCQM